MKSFGTNLLTPAFYLYYEKCACDETANEDVLVPQDPQTHFVSLLLVKLSF